MTLIAISGGSGSGKTTLARTLKDLLGDDQCAILYQDSYYLDQSARFDGDGGSVNFDHPDALDFELMAEHLALLKSGKTCQVPQYCFKDHTRLPETTPLAPKEYILVDGILILSQPKLRALFDHMIFVETAESVRLERRLFRDVEERGRSREGVLKQFSTQVKPMHDLFVEPSKAFAQTILSGEVSIEETCRGALQALNLPQGLKCKLKKTPKSSHVV